MNYKAKSIRSFIGAKDFNESRTFYQELGFEEVIISGDMSLFKVNEAIGFYLQDAYVKDWLNNSMVFIEVDDVDKCYEDLQNLVIPGKYKNVKLSPIKSFDWGRECFLHDPSGVLWHFGQFGQFVKG
ncbi:MAG: hypothetical protein ACI8P3_003137 [Saprospiraceae bacterium]|jgi:catechol 2,3-dioxygenase-like lactoylglutathione lyase family enzyme